MGTLEGWAYPTALFGKLADHTYVRCGNGGKAWGCFGGKTGGQRIARGSGSTLRADTIATPKEQAGLQCYLVNGVCHQAANRILFPAQVTVRKAKLYWLSVSLYGDYGRPAGPFGTCPSPFYQHPDVTGDLAACKEAPGAASAADDEDGGEDDAGFGDEAMRDYLATVTELYSGFRPLTATVPLDVEEVRDFQLTLFGVLVDYKLGSEYRDTSEQAQLLEIRNTTENLRLDLETDFFERGMDVEEFVGMYNELILRFQDECSETLPADRYRELFGLEPDERGVLGHPDLVRQAYGDR